MDLAQLGISVDSTQAKQAATDLDALAGAGDRAGESAEGVAKSAKVAADALHGTTSGANATATAYNTISQSGNGAAAQAQRLVTELDRTVGSQQRVAVSAGQTRAAFQQLQFQLTDVVTSLASGQNPFTVLIQQGGQIKDSFGGIGPTFRALGSLITPVSVGVTALGVAAGSLAVGFVKGREEAEEFRKALILGGNAAGTTTSELINLAAATDPVAGTQFEAAKALAAFAQSGRVASGSLKEFSETALLLQKSVGQSIEDTVRTFERLRQSPVEAIAKLNESMHFLDAATFNRIKSLQDQGREEEAAALAQKTYSDAAGQRAREVIANFSPLESLFVDIKDGAKSMWDSILNVGREDSLDQQLNRVQARLKELRTGEAVGLTGIPLTSSQTNEERQRLETLQESLRLGSRVEANNAAATAGAAAITEKYIEAGKELDRFKTKEQRFADEARRLRDAFAAREAGGTPVSVDEQTRIIADAREKIFGKGRTARTAGRSVENAQLNLDLQDIKAASQQVIDIYNNSERILEAQRAAGLLSEGEYYEAKREFLQSNARLQVQELQAENARLDAEKSTGRDRINQDRQIAQNKAAIVRIQQDAAAKAEVLGIQEAAAQQKVADSYKQAEFAARSYLQELQRSQSATLAGLGLGSEQRERRAAQESTRQRFEQEKERLTQQLSLKQITQDQYDELIRIQNQYEEQSLAGFNEYYDELDARQADWTVGAAEALANFESNSENVAKTTEQAFNKALGSITDTFTTFITTGKADWKGLADSIVADIIRVMVQAETLQVIKWAMGATGGTNWVGLIGSALGIASGGGAAANTAEAASSTADFITAANSAPLAHGGFAAAGSAHLVNENGPELLTIGGNTFLMMGDQPGYVTPNGQWGGGGFTQNVYFSSTGPIDKRTQMQLGAEVYKQGQLASSRNN